MCALALVTRSLEHWADPESAHRGLAWGTERPTPASFSRLPGSPGCRWPRGQWPGAVFVSSSRSKEKKNGRICLHLTCLGASARARPLRMQHPSHAISAVGSDGSAAAATRAQVCQRIPKTEPCHCSFQKQWICRWPSSQSTHDPLKALNSSSSRAGASCALHLSLFLVEKQGATAPSESRRRRSKQRTQPASSTRRVSRWTFRLLRLQRSHGYAEYMPPHATSFPVIV